MAAQAPPITARFARSALLRRWIAARYLDAREMRRIREDARARPYMRYAVLDGFLDDRRCRQLLARHRRLEFIKTDLYSPFDSFLVGGTPEHFGGELWFSSIWQEYLSALLGVPLEGRQPTKVMLRRHRPLANGFWLHTDRNVESPTAIGMFFYLNRGWTAADGGLLQFWRTAAQRASDEQVIRWIRDKERRLDFLLQPDIDVEVGDERNELATFHFILLDQILPAYNRMVLCDFLSDPTYHSVTPGQSKIRYDITQRLF